MNILFISNCDFRGNSAMHIFSIANQLAAWGDDCVVCVPWRPRTVYAHGAPAFRVVTFAEAGRHKIRFRNKGKPDIIHAWTPRELVRKFTEDLVAYYRCPFLVHLEDNEEVLFENELPAGVARGIDPHCPEFERYVVEGRIHPLKYREFLASASGLTVLVERLLEFRPPHIPGLVFWPGYDDAFRNLPDSAPRLRARFGIRPGDSVIVYTGSVHASNLDEVQSLYEAVALLNDRGHPVKLIKTGNLHADPAARMPGADKFILNAGFVPRKKLPGILALADVLVQPGRPGRFNDYRFPSKLPEYFVSGRPVVLPKANIGLHIVDGEEGLLLSEGGAEDIAEKVGLLLKDRGLQKKIGGGGRRFALQELGWPANVRLVRDFYGQFSGPAPVPAAYARQRGHDSSGALMLSIVIISFNTRELLRECIRAVHGAAGNLDYEIIIVDNASTDGSIEEIEALASDRMTLIRNPENGGFARANNQAIKIARGRYLLLLNSDAFIKDGAIDELVSFMDAHPRAAAAGPKILNMDGTLQNQGFCFPSIAGSMLFLLGVSRIVSPRGLHRLFPRLYWDENETSEVDFLHGCCMLVRRDALVATGGFSEDYFMYFEEQDWCFRAGRHGYKIWYVPSAGVFHHGAASPLNERSAVFNRSMLLFYRKNLGTVRGSVIASLQILSSSISFIRAYFKPRDARDLESVRTYLYAQVNLLKGLLGMGKEGL